MTSTSLLAWFFMSIVLSCVNLSICSEKSLLLKMNLLCIQAQLLHTAAQLFKEFHYTCRYTGQKLNSWQDYQLPLVQQENDMNYYLLMMFCYEKLRHHHTLNSNECQQLEDIIELNKCAIYLKKDDQMCTDY